MIVQSADKDANPLVATIASPGMGKSTLIDAITSLTLEQIKELSPSDSTDEFHRAMSESARIPIDYNGYQPVSRLDLEHPEAAAGLRILHSYVHLPFVSSLLSLIFIIIYF